MHRCILRVEEDLCSGPAKMSSSESASVNDIEKKAPDKTSTVAEGDISNVNISPANPHYDRYLELHRQFDGKARAKFVRKRESDQNVWRPNFGHGD